MSAGCGPRGGREWSYQASKPLVVQPFAAQCRRKGYTAGPRRCQQTSLPLVPRLEQRRAAQEALSECIERQRFGRNADLARCLAQGRRQVRAYGDDHVRLLFLTTRQQTGRYRFGAIRYRCCVPYNMPTALKTGAGSRAVSPRVSSARAKTRAFFHVMRGKGIAMNARRAGPKVRPPIRSRSSDSPER